MIMTLDVGERLMSITDLSEMLGVPIHTLYRWRRKGEGPVGYRIGRHVKYRRATVEAWLETQRTSARHTSEVHQDRREAADQPSWGTPHIKLVAIRTW
jgi:excisionase family DNA binding protein